MGDWQPIETAPHDTYVLVKSGDVVSFGLFDDDRLGGGFWDVHPHHENWFHTHPPTHWMTPPGA
jgi:hypothetical protein